MRKKFPLLILIVTLLTSCILISCDRTQPQLTIATSKWPGYAFISLAKQEGWLADKNIKIVEKNSATEILEALKSGQVMGSALTMDEVLRVREQGIPLQVVMVFNKSAGGDALIVKKSVKHLSELKGMRIGLELSAVGALMLYKILDKANLNEIDVELVDTTIDQQLDGWKKDKFDAVITYEPVASQIEQMGGYRLLDTRAMPGLILDVLAVRADIASNYTDELRHLTQSHFRALKRMQTHPQDTAYRLAEHLGLNGNEVQAAFRGMVLPDLATNRRYLSNKGNVLTTAHDISAILLKNNLLSKKADLTNFVSAHYLPVEP